VLSPLKELCTMSRRSSNSVAAAQNAGVALNPGVVLPAPAVVGLELAGGADVAVAVVAGAVVSAATVVGALVGVVVAVVGVVVAVVVVPEPSSSELLHATSDSVRAPTSPNPLIQRRIDTLLRLRRNLPAQVADSCATSASVSSTGA
jgi:hypothetical protein